MQAASISSTNRQPALVGGVAQRTGTGGSLDLVGQDPGRAGLPAEGVRAHNPVVAVVAQRHGPASDEGLLQSRPRRNSWRAGHGPAPRTAMACCSIRVGCGQAWWSARFTLYLLILRLTTRAAARRRRAGTNWRQISAMAPARATARVLVVAPRPARTLRRAAFRLRVNEIRSGSSPELPAASAINARMA